MRQDDVRGRIPVGVLGATGTVGQRMVRLLLDHPWFELTEVGASESSAGSTLGARWVADGAGPLPAEAGRLVLREMEGEWSAPILLSALPSGVAGPLEPELRRRGHLVVSNASSHRMVPDVPLIVPEVNPDHAALVERQDAPPGGGLLTNPNCAVAGLVMALAPLHRAFGLERAVVTTFQAISGAGRPGPPAGELLGNVLPFIRGEEEKFGLEPQKILGTLTGDRIDPAPFPIGATSTRVPVQDGHLVSVSAAFGTRPSAEEATEVLRRFRRAEVEVLPSAPPVPLHVFEDDDRPQPRIDSDLGGGMTTSVGRVRPCPALHIQFVVLAHNLVRGAAGAALLNAELCHARRRAAAPAPVGPGA